MKTLLAFAIIATGLLLVAALGWACIESGVAGTGDGAYSIGEYGEP